MAAYFVALINFKDRERFRIYEEAFPALFSQTNGKVLGVSEAPDVVAGTWDTDRLVVLEFPSVEEGKAFFASDTYKAIAAHRDAGAEVNAVMIPAYQP